MKRHPSLHPLSEHHHHALVQALEIARAKRAGPERASKLQQAVASLLHFWDSAGRTHFREEEDVLLPALARHVRLDEEPAVMRMLADHAQIRGALQDLSEDLRKNRLEESQVTKLGQLLHDHVRLEEDTIFPRIESLLTEQELASLLPRLTQLHPK